MALDKDLIQQPSLWQLVLDLSDTSLGVMAFSPIEHHALIYESIPLDNTSSQPATHPLEEAVYANTLLLGDFSKVRILSHASRFLVVDTDTAEDEARRMFAVAYPPQSAPEKMELMADELPTCHCRILFEIPQATLGFLRRTFNNPPVNHFLSPLVLYSKSKYPHRSAGKMMVNLAPERVDVVVLGDKSPMLVNSYPIHSPMDAVYYIMAAREAFDLPATQELLLAGGDATLRSAVTAQLRRFVRFVMPAIFPSVMVRAGRAALRTPFPLVVTPLVFNT